MALGVLQSFGSNDLASAFWTYPAGKVITEHAESLIKRNKIDDVGDAIFMEIAERLGIVRGQNLLTTLSESQWHGLLDLSEPIRAKIMEFLGMWSNPHLEDRAADLCTMLRTLSQLPLKVDFDFAEYICRKLGSYLQEHSETNAYGYMLTPPTPRAVSSRDQQPLGPEPCGTISLHSDFEVEVDNLQLMLPLADRLRGVSFDLIKFLEAVVVPRLNTSRLADDVIQTIIAKLHTVMDRCTAWAAIMNGARDVLVLAELGIQDVEDAFSQYKAWKGRESKAAALGEPFVEPRPYLEVTLSLCRHRKSVLQLGDLSYTGPRTPGRDVEYPACIGFLVSHPVGQSIFASHVSAHVHAAVAHFASIAALDELAICSERNHNDSSMATIEESIPSLFRSDFATSAKTVLSFCCFKNPKEPQVFALPHFVRVEAANLLVTECVVDSFKFPSLQNTSGTPLHKDHCRLLLQTYANVRTSSILAAALHHRLFSDLGILDDEGVDMTTVSMLSYTTKCTENLMATLSADLVISLDRQGYRLYFSIQSLKGWVAALNSTLERLKQYFCDRIIDGAQRVASALDELVPKSSNYINDTTFNADMAQNCILKNEKHSDIIKLHARLGNIMSDSNFVASLFWNAKINDKISNKASFSFAAAVDASAALYFLLHHALKAMITYGRSARGISQAKSVLKLNSEQREDSSKLPATAVAILEKLSDGDRSSLPDIPNDCSKQPMSATMKRDALEHSRSHSKRARSEAMAPVVPSGPNAADLAETDFC